MSVIKSFFIAQLREDGSHWTKALPVYASVLLAEIEQIFGPRDRTFTLFGIEIDSTSGARPHLWYPVSGIAPDDPERRSRHVVIRPTSNALTNPVRAMWQLAHECFHLLDPWG